MYTRLGALAVAVVLIAGCGEDGADTAAPASTDAMSDEMSGTADDMSAMSDEMSGDMAGMEHDHDHDHDHAEVVAIPADGAPTVDVSAEMADDVRVQLHIETTDFTFVEDGTGSGDGYAGHAHVIVDGGQVAMVFDPDPAVALDAGDHLVRVELQDSSHVPLAIDGRQLIFRELSVHVPEGTGDEFRAAPVEAVGPADADLTVPVVVAEGAVEGGARTVELEAGTVVAIELTADVADELHVHGYDELAEVVPGETTTLVFTADLPGVWEVELENRGLLLLELEVHN
jgi:outer membrane murein-binding lipoprotein Lpp